MAAKQFFVIGFVPLCYFLFLWYYAMRKKKSLRSVIWPFIWGGISTIPLLLLSWTGVQNIFSAYSILSILFLAFSEEGSKSSVVLVLGKSQTAGWVGIGFSCVENLFYFTNSAVLIMDHIVLFYVLRIVIDGIGHFLFTSISTRYSVLYGPIFGIIISTFFHSLFNYFMVWNVFFLIFPLFYLMHKLRFIDLHLPMTKTPPSL